VSEPVKSVLHDAQEAVGATFREEDGWLWTESIGSDLAGYEAVRDGMAIWDIYPLIKWEITGPDAGAAIQRVYTADLSRQGIGKVKYGAFVDDAGLLVDDGTVYKHAEDRYWVLTNAEDTGEHLMENARGLQFTLVNRTLEMPLISAQGPRSREILQGMTEADLSRLRYYNFLTERVQVAGVTTWLARTGFSGELGFELIPDPDGAPKLWAALNDAGGVPFGLTVLEPVRVEAGLIVYGSDYDPGEDTPYDVSMDRYVSLDSDVDFLGRQVLGQIAAAPPRRLVTLRISGDELPEMGAPVFAEGSSDGVAIGTVTSPADSPRMGLLALAKIDTPASAIGTTVRVEVGGTTAEATVAELSIKDPEKLRPRV